VRGTSNVVNALYDAEALMRWDSELGMRVHRGFDAMARVVYEDLKPRLDLSRPLVLFGHSLGAAEVVLLSLLLERDGYKVLRVYSSGQPKVTDHEGAVKCKTLPLLRISCELDPVPFLPPRVAAPQRPYEQFGKEIILLDGPYYTVSQGRLEEESESGAIWGLLKQTGARTAIRLHLIANYLVMLRGKDKEAIEVPYADRLRYLSEPTRQPAT
jgi:triacylglycerol lipase